MFFVSFYLPAFPRRYFELEIYLRFVLIRTFYNYFLLNVFSASGSSTEANISTNLI